MQFSEGSLVEVSSGFTGAWFPARVIEVPTPLPFSSKSSSSRSGSKRKSSLVLVEYTHVAAKEGSLERMRESVDLSFVRPHLQDVGQVSFKLNELVNVFVVNRWWTGIVNGVLDQFKYCVLFQKPSDQMLCTSLQLRPHMEWIDGNWIRVKPMTMEDFIFSAGSEVEVQHLGEGFQDAWLPATVLQQTVCDRSIIVSYQNSINIDGVEYLEGTVSMNQVRPSPPKFQNQEFILLDKAEAFNGSCWRSGVIKKLLPGMMYCVYFKTLDEEKNLHYSDLRPLMEWKDAKWFSCQELLNNSAHREQPRMEFNINSKSDLQSGTVVAEGDKPEKQTPSADEKSSSHADSSRKIIKQTINDDATLSCKGGDETEITSSHRIHKLKILRSAASPKKHHSVSVNPATSTFDSCSSKKSMGNLENDSGIGSNQIALSGKKSNPEKDHSVRSTRKERRLKELDTLFISPPTRRRKGCIHENLSERSLQLKIPEHCHSKIPMRRRSLERVRVYDGDSSTPLKRGRGRPRKLEITSQIVSEPGKQIEGDGNVGVAATDKIVIKDQETSGLETGTRSIEPATNVMAMEELQTADRPELDNQLMLRESALDDVIVCEESEGDHICIDATVVVAASTDTDVHKLQTNESETGKIMEPASDVVAMEEPQIDTAEPEGEHILSPNSPTKGSESDDGTVCQEPEHRIVGTTTPGIQRSFRIERKSPIWKSVESMEAFRKVPQAPHFEPLFEENETVREGLAIGLMVGFAEVVNRASNLNWEDPVSTFEGLLKALEELRAYGFDVDPVGHRVKELISARNSHLGLSNRARAVDGNILAVERKKRDAEERISGIRKEIEDLKEKCGMVEKVLEGSVLELRVLRTEIEGIEEEKKNVAVDFQCLKKWEMPNVICVD